jgi:hypothetical protein
VVRPIVNAVTNFFTGSGGGGRTVYPSNFIGPLPAGARVVWYGNQAYNLNDATQYATYVRKVNAEAIRKRAEARVKKQCESATKISTSAEQQRKNLEKAFGKPNSKGQYYIPSPTGTGGGRWMSLDEAKRLTSKDIDWKKVIAAVGLGGLTLLATILAPEITIPSFALGATTSGTTAWVVAGTTTVSLAPATSIAGTISIAGIVGNNNSGGGSNDSGYYKKGLKDVPDNWAEIETVESKITSQSFKDFLNSQGQNPNKWRKIMEKWGAPDGTIYQRHYWTNGKDYYYHGTGLEEFSPH